ncbi:hypothetical protein ABIB73_003417 [Bradyrhizobium sp. F1.4.3]
MWTLILVVIVAANANTGGVSTSTTFLDFPDQAKCEAAAAGVAVDDYTTLPTNAYNNRPPTFYRIVAKCAAR